MAVRERWASPLCIFTTALRLNLILLKLCQNMNS
jgi:hypothetical protein